MGGRIDIETDDVADLGGELRIVGKRRYTRLTNAFSKKFENHCHMVALYTVWYNWMRKHKAHKQTPAVAAGLTDQVLDMSHIARLVDAREAQMLTDRRRATLENTVERKLSYLN